MYIELFVGSSLDITKTHAMRYLVFLSILLISNKIFSHQTQSIYFHTDRDIYFPGETIWFNAYSPSDTGKLLSLNVGLYSPTGNKIKEKIFILANGVALGDFEIPDTVSSSSLQILAATKNQIAEKNFQNVKYLLVQNIPDSTMPHATSFADATGVVVKPEGGWVVSGVVNYFVLKSFSAYNGPQIVYATLMEVSNGKFIDSVITGKDGLASFQFIPEFGKNYILRWKDVKGFVGEKPIPSSINTGAILHTELKGDSLHYLIEKKSSLPYLNELDLEVLQNKRLIGKYRIKMKEVNKYISAIDALMLPLGLLHLNLRDASGALLQETQVWNNTGTMPLSMSLVDKNLSAHGKNTIEITLTDTLNQDVSISVSDLMFYDTANVQVNPPIVFPGSAAVLYGSNKQIAENLISIGKKQDSPVRDFDQDNVGILAEVKHKDFDLPARSILALVVDDKITGKQFYKLPPKGPKQFRADNIIFFDSAKVYYRVEGFPELNDKLKFGLTDTTALPKSISARYIWESAIVDNSNGVRWERKYNIRVNKKYAEGKLLPNVMLKSAKTNPKIKRILELDEKYATGTASGIGRGFQLNVMDDENLWTYSDLPSYLKAKLSLYIINRCYKKVLLKTPYDISTSIPIFIDDTQVPLDDDGTPDGSWMNLSLTQIAYIKYIPGIVSGSSFRSNNGVLYIYTKKGKDMNSVLYDMNAMRKVTVNGYNLAKQFEYYVPGNDKKFDNRSTLYWNPIISLTKENPTFRFSYFNNEIAAKHLLTITTMDSEGRLFVYKKLIE